MEYNCVNKLYISDISHYTGTYPHAFTATGRASKLCIINCNDKGESSINEHLFSSNWTLCYLIQSWSAFNKNVINFTSLLLQYSNLVNLLTLETKGGTLETEPRYLQLYDKEKRKHTPTSTADTSRGQVSCVAQAGKWKRTKFNCVHQDKGDKNP